MRKLGGKGDLRTLLFCVLAGWLLASSVAAQPQQQEQMPDLQKPITLDQALEIAFRQSPTIKVALAQIQRSQATVAEARANFLPKFNGEVIQQWQGPKVAFVAPGTTKELDIMPASDTRANASVLLPLDINNRLSFTTQIARYQNEIDYLNLRSISQQLIFDVKSAYYNVLRAMGQEEVAQAAVDAANARLREANVRFTAGTAPKFDVTRAQVDVANLNQSLIQAKARVATAISALNRVLGIDVNFPTQVVKNTVAIEDVKVDIPKSVEQAQTLRPEVMSLERLIRLNQTNARLQRTGVMPSLNATGQVTYDVKASGFSTSNTSWIAMLDLKIPIWDGGITAARVAQAYADANKATEQLEETKLLVALQTRTAALNLQEAIERVSTADANVALAEEALRLASVRYEAGVATLVEVTDAEAALTQAKTNAVNARYDYAVALADLQRATSTQPEVQKLQLLCPQFVTAKSSSGK